MNVQINPSVTNPTIADIFERMVDGKLELQPDFQRKFVWTQDHQEEFLDTIINGYPFPEIYVCQGEFDAEKLRTSQVVIDGQQRLTTIKNYIEETFVKPLRMIVPFSELTDAGREAFMTYKIVVRDIGKVEDELVKEIFRRINLTKFKLEDIEIHNAIYDGKFISTAKLITSKIELEKYGVFHESEFTRMADIYFVLQLMCTLERGGYYNRDSEIEKCIAEFNDDYDNSADVYNKILAVFSVIDKLGLELDSIWFRKSNFFTMIVELIQTPKHPDDLLVKLNKMDEQVLKHKHKPDTEFGTYYSYMYQGTNNRKARVIRGETFRKHILQ